MPRIMIQGTTSSAGKSITVTALCRIFSRKGLSIVPFKSQNMSSKFIELEDGSVISSAQALQAKACNLSPTKEMNPILLKPVTDMGSEVFLTGESKGVMSAKDYHEYKKELKPIIKDIYLSLEKNYDLVIIEGAGSPAEINLRENDLVNMGMAQIADSKVILVADIDRGGVFASLYGTIMLLEKEERDRIKGFIINKFRGDKDLLMPGIKTLENLTGIPVIGVIPYMQIELADEDSLVDHYKRSNNVNLTEKEIEEEIERIADIFEDNLDMNAVFDIVGIDNGIGL